LVISYRVLAEALAANGADAEALAAADEAVRLAYSTQQTSERAAADAVRARLTVRANASVPFNP
jgi:hypothetical protein